MISSLNDSLNLVSKLSRKRLVNAAAVLGSYYLSRISGRPRHAGLPISLSIEPTTACNLRCPECPSGLRAFTRPTGMLQEKTFRKVVDELRETLCYMLFYFQGEPYLNRQFLDWVAYASSRGIYTATSTNAHYLDDVTARRTVESGLDRLIVSIDGTTQETYEAYRKGGQLSKVLEGTRNVVAWKKKLGSRTPHIVFQFLVVRPNEHQVEEVKTLARELGVDAVGFKTAQIYDYQQGSPLIPRQQKYSRYRRLANGTYRIKNKLLNHCWKMWHSCVITWDGKVVPCCFDKDASHQLGDMQQQSFRQIWRGEAYCRFRQSLMRSRSEIDICQNCTEGTKIWA
jgi:radical SAM protein with 4Fe4S-binding SPASM domain